MIEVRFDMPRVQTAYQRLTNRCPNCGHRLSMREGASRCAVVTGKASDPSVKVVCPCKEHVR